MMIGAQSDEQKIISEYLKTLVFAVVATLVAGALLCYLLFFGGKTVDTSMPQYLILNIYQYLSQSEAGFSLEEEGMEKLDVHDLWLQIVDGDGAAVYAYNTNSDIPDAYTNFKLVNITLTSDRLPGYTVYASAYDSGAGEYTVLIGWLPCHEGFLQSVRGQSDCGDAMCRYLPGRGSAVCCDCFHRLFQKNLHTRSGYDGGDRSRFQWRGAQSAAPKKPVCRGVRANPHIAGQAGLQ
ncbi:MAG: hypothetical protein LUD82_00190 [Clostridiales bacterium]|nr:hypothetical protein [Clostridiales bacterium]